MKPKCSLDGCPNPAMSRGWCERHYSAWRRNGTPETTNRYYSDPMEALSARTKRRGSCIEWTGSTSGIGYGRIKVRGKGMLVHRFAWEQANGPIPEGKFVDHTCHNRLCINVEHLRLADPQQNARNRTGAKPGSKTGVRNVLPSKNGDRFRVRITVNGRPTSFGTYDTLREAEAVATAKRKELFGEFAGGGR